MLPGVVLGLFASARIDRMRKLPILIASDLLRAAVLVSVPLAAWWDVLRMEQLYFVALLSGLLSFVFDVAHGSYLPSLVERRELVAANSRLKGAEAVTEAGAFASGGWLVQWLTAPVALLSRIRRPEPAPAPSARAPVLEEIREGAGFVWTSATLRPLVVATVVAAFSFQVFGVVYLLFASQELGFQPGTLGSIFAIGAGSSLVGALFARRAMLRLGLGNALWGGLALVAVTMGLLPFAPGAAAGLLFLALHQLGDGFEVVYSVNAVSLRQAVTPRHFLGRVNGSFEFATLGAMLLGTGVGGVLGETLGLRATLGVGAVGMGVAALCIVFSPVGRLRRGPSELDAADAADPA
jgi:MFS family permease